MCLTSFPKYYHLFIDKALTVYVTANDLEQSLSLDTARNIDHAWGSVVVSYSHGLLYFPRKTSYEMLLTHCLAVGT